MSKKFNKVKVPHFHPCVCHIIENVSMKDETGKVWTQQEIQEHIEELNTIEEEQP